MAMITPTRFGIKYAPIPTLALEYEEDMGVADDESGTRSLYVFKEQHDSQRRVRKKVHVVELPHLTRQSEAIVIARQLQKDDYRFLGPTVVKEQQLRRLLQQLVDHLELKEDRETGARPVQRVESGLDAPSMSDMRGGAFDHKMQGTAIEANRLEKDDDGEDDELGESMMEESIAEASATFEASQGEEENSSGNEDQGDKHPQSSVPGLGSSTQRGSFIAHDESDQEDDEHPPSSPLENAEERRSATEAPMQNAAAQEDDEDAAEDEKKKQALKSESEVSEEEVQSEELEYFSEDGSDEDSF